MWLIRFIKRVIAGIGLSITAILMTALAVLCSTVFGLAILVMLVAVIATIGLAIAVCALVVPGRVIRRCLEEIV